MKLEDILQEFNIPYKTAGQHHHAREGWIQMDCPFCGRDSHKWHLGFSLEHKFFNCWKCGPHPTIATLSAITGLPYYRAKSLLNKIIPSHTQKEKRRGKLILPKGVGPLRHAHRKYLQERGFNWQEIERLWGVRGIGIAARLAWRLFIPIVYHGNVVSWTTRAICDHPNTPRYISASKNEESIPHHELLYGEDYVRNSVVVTEGVFDVWRIGPGAVCTFSTNYTTAQLLKISRYPVRVICYDNEPEAQKRAKRLANDLSVFPGDTYNIVLDKKDPAAEKQRNIDEIRKKFLY